MKEQHIFSARIKRRTLPTEKMGSPHSIDITNTHLNARLSDDAVKTLVLLHNGGKAGTVVFALKSKYL